MLIGDSAYPPATYPTEVGGKPVVGWCVYIGGNTPHVWTEAEIAHLMAQPWCRYVLPVYVRSRPTGVDQAQRDAAAAIAWSKAHNQPRGTLVMWDYETAVNSAYELAVDAALRAGDGDLEVLYGSKSTVVQNTAPSGGYDEADWTGADHAPASMAVQFLATAGYDMNDFRDSAPLWDLHPAPPAPTTAAHAALEEDSMLIESKAVHPDEYTAVVPNGVGELVLAAGGEARGPASVRVTLWNNDKAQPPQTFTVGGSGPHHVVGHALAGATAVTVQRLDEETYTVAAGFRA